MVNHDQRGCAPTELTVNGFRVSTAHLLDDRPYRGVCVTVHVNETVTVNLHRRMHLFSVVLIKNKHSSTVAVNAPVDATVDDIVDLLADDEWPCPPVDREPFEALVAADRLIRLNVNGL